LRGNKRKDGKASFMGGGSMSGVPSPVSTGAGGTTFEHKVQTEFVCIMLGGGKVCIDRFQEGYIIDNISFQTRYRHINTDDMLVTFKPINGISSRIFAQIKLTIMLTDNELFREVIKGFWNDFNSGIFNRENDVFAIIMGLPTNMSTYQDTLNLLDRARTSLNSNDFLLKVNANRNIQNVFNLFKNAVENAKGTSANDNEMWNFLKCIYVISYDYNSDTSQAQRNIIQFLDTVKRRVNGSESAWSVWNDLFALVAEVNFKAGVITRETVFNKYPSLRDWFDHSVIQINPVEYEIGRYKLNMKEMISSSAGIVDENIRTLLLESMEEVYSKLLEIDTDILKGFLKKYQYPRETNNNISFDGIGELFELLTYVNCRIKNWSLKSFETANLQLIERDKTGWVQLIYSTRKSTMPIIIIDLGTKLYGQTPDNNYFKHRWIIENANMDLDRENLCEMCGIGRDFPFSKVLTDFGKTRKIGIFEGVPKDENTYSGLGTIKICCAKCVRKLREMETAQALQDKLLEVLIGD
jgi:hypothetical protein